MGPSETNNSWGLRGEKSMECDGLRVLLIGKSENGLCHLRAQLESRGCHCWLAPSPGATAHLLAGQSFDLVLSTTWLHADAPLLARLMESHCTVFFSYPVRNGCWWLPIAYEGEQCQGAPALRSAEFAGVLDQIARTQSVGVAAA
jgi:hypothetical protein